jgi:hypothetical protein
LSFFLLLSGNYGIFLLQSSLCNRTNYSILALSNIRIYCDSGFYTAQNNIHPVTLRIMYYSLCIRLHNFQAHSSLYIGLGLDLDLVWYYAFSKLNEIRMWSICTLFYCKNRWWLFFMIKPEISDRIYF